MAKKKTAKKKSTVEKDVARAVKSIADECGGSCKNSAQKCCKKCNCSATGGCLYFVGFLGAAVYYISAATSFWVGVLGVLKALFWPAFVVYHLMRFLGM